MSDDANRTQQDEMTGGVAPRVLRARSAAEGALAQENWDAAMLACGKVFEEVAKAELPYNERGGTLGQLLDKLPKEVDLDAPVRELAAELKRSSGLAAAFDLEREATPELARAGLELVDAFLTYLYGFREALARMRALAEEDARSAGRGSQGGAAGGRGRSGEAFDRFASSSGPGEE